MAHMDSTRAIIRLWRLCAPTTVGPEVGGDGALPVDVLRSALEPELQARASALACRSVDEIFMQFLQPDAAGVLGFLQFWRGMEDILMRCGTHRVGISPANADAVEGFRYLRTCVLEMSSRDDSLQARTVFSVSELRYFIERTTEVARGPEGKQYWRERIAHLPVGDVFVTGEEVASALLSWLEELVCEDILEDADDDELEDSADEGTMIPQARATTQSQSLASATAAAVGVASTGVRDGLVLNLPPPPASPKGPPPRRSVLGGRSPHEAMEHASPGQPLLRTSGASGGGRGVGSRQSVGTDCNWSDVSPGGVHRVASALECGLIKLLQNSDRRPPTLTKAEAADWRDAMEFKTELRRHILDQQPVEKEFTFEDFHTFSVEYASSASARRASISPRGVSPRQRAAARSGAMVMRIVLESLHRRRLAEGLGAWLEAWRRVPRSSPASSGFDILRSLLASQCKIAVSLEHRLKIAGRAGGLADFLMRLVRRQLRDPLIHWRRLMLEPGLSVRASAASLPAFSPPAAALAGLLGQTSPSRALPMAGRGRVGATPLLPPASSPYHTSDPQLAQQSGGYPSVVGRARRQV